MEKFKIGQVVKCVWSDDEEFIVNNKYKITDVCDEYMLLDGEISKNAPCKTKDSSIARFDISRFEPVTKKFTAVSGDQSLFDLVGASDDELYVVKASTTNAIYAHHLNAGNVIAERKPYIEKYVPKVGDVFYISEFARQDFTCLFIDKNGYIHSSCEGRMHIFFNGSKTTFVKVDK